MALNKKQWLNQSVFVDVYGRPHSLSDVPMTYMTREKALLKRGTDKESIEKLYQEYLIRNK